jgi:hypothetical protein
MLLFGCKKMMALAIEGAKKHDGFGNRRGKKT